ncbi:HAD family hydrolase [Planktomarina sp.]|nr:HAD family hydrolase [Planktomarina sp.]MDA9100790.1 HAD family hydrolase [Planktomarina sp.]
MTLVNKAIFLDRDGVINKDLGYVYRVDDLVFLPRALDAIRLFTESGYLIIVVTNQSGISRGYYSYDDFRVLTEYILSQVESAGGRILETFYCPHYYDGVVTELATQCDCRKPAPGMIFQARDKYSIDLKRSFLIGDKTTDIKAANLAGVGKAYLISEGARGLSGQSIMSVDVAKIFPSLWNCALDILS